MSKILTVFGATGNQGGAVIKSVLAHPELSKNYKIRAISRDAGKAASLALKEKGVEVIEANLDDKDSLIRAVNGSSVVFGVTNYLETLDGEAEFVQGKNIVDAVKVADIDRFIFSSLPYVERLTKGQNKRLDHFDSKARVEEHARSQGVPGTYYLPGVFMSLVFDSLVPDEQGSYSWKNPLPAQTQVPLIDAGVDTGTIVAAILLNLETTLNKRIWGTSGFATPEEILKQYSEVTGRQTRYDKMSYDEFAKMIGPAVGSQLSATFEWMDTPGYYLGEPDDGVNRTLELVNQSPGVAKLMTWKDYVKERFSH